MQARACCLVSLPCPVCLVPGRTSRCSSCGRLLAWSSAWSVRELAGVPGARAARAPRVAGYCLAVELRARCRRMAARAARMPAGTPRMRLVQRMTARVRSAAWLGSGPRGGLPRLSRMTRAPVQQLDTRLRASSAPAASSSRPTQRARRVQSVPVRRTDPVALGAPFRCWQIAPAETRSPVRGGRWGVPGAGPTPGGAPELAGVPGFT